MSYLKEQAEWTDGIYQIETSDPVLGGPDGITNRPARELANRTAWLKQQLKEAENALTAHTRSRNHPDASLSEKGFVKLSNANQSSSETEAATPKAVKIVNDRLNAVIDSAPSDLDTLNKLAKAISNNPKFAENVMQLLSQKLAKNDNGADIPDKNQFIKNLGLLEKENRWINKQIFNTLISGNIDGNAASATRLQTARKIAGVAFNGNADISIPASNVGAYTKAEVDSRINAKGAKNTAHLATNGWWKCGDTSFIRQWGITPPLNAGQIYTVSLPCPVPHAILSATATVKYKGIASEGNLGTYVEIVGKSLIISADYTRTGIKAPRTWELVCY